MHIDYELSITQLPKECILQCSHSGDCYDDVEAWRVELGFTVDRRKAIDCLTGYGAWDDLEEWDDERLARTILWLACSDFSEYMVYCDRDKVDPFGERPEGYDTPAGSDCFILE